MSASLDVRFCSPSLQLSLHLDTMENKALLANTLIVLLSCCVAFSGVAASGFGMNLSFSLLININFYAVVAVSSIAILVFFYLAKKYLIYGGWIPSKILLSKTKVVRL